MCSNAFVTALIAIVASTYSAAAAQPHRIDVSWHGGKHHRIFSESSLSGGEKFVRPITIRNRTATPVDVFLRIDNLHGKTLARAVYLGVRDSATRRYALGGRGDRVPLREAATTHYFITRLSAQETRQYDIIAWIDDDLPNAAQGARTRFDIDVYIREAERESSPPYRSTQHPQGNAEPQVLGVETDDSHTGEDIIIQDTGTIVQQCRPFFSSFTWLILSVLALGGALHTYRRSTRRIHGISYSVLMILFGILWFIVERFCHAWWVPVIIIGIIVVLAWRMRTIPGQEN